MIKMVIIKWLASKHLDFRTLKLDRDYNTNAFLHGFVQAFNV